MESLCDTKGFSEWDKLNPKGWFLYGCGNAFEWD